MLTRHSSRAFFELESAGEVQEALKQKGVELTEEEILSIREFIIKIENGKISVEQLEKWVTQVENGEIPEEMLEQVSGGVLGSVLVVLSVAAIAYAGVAFLTLSIMDAVERRW